MKEEEKLVKIIDKITKNEIKKQREKYIINHGDIDNYVYKKSEKIFRKLIFPYFRFEILLRLVEDIIKHDKYYLYYVSYKKYVYI